MLIQYSDAQKKENSKGCTVWEYDFSNKDIGLAIAHIQGRFPEIGKAVNHKCDEIYYVISGT
jgi:mannose-6-phosphate isomerase-like protein (cupin superfamily)